MNSIGFAVSGKENEKRRAVLPQHLDRVEHRSALCFETGYGRPLGIEDSAYAGLGCRLAERAAVYDCDIVCNPKAPEPAERSLFKPGQTLFGWVHAVQGRSIVDFLLKMRMTAVAWEDMFEDERHCFWRNNEIAGEAAILHALPFLGRLPHGLKAAIIGRGNCARGAHRVLAQLGAEITIYDRKTAGLLRAELGRFDIVVNAVTWDVFRTDHLIETRDLKSMKRDAMIIDISCDEKMGIESSRPTSICDPVYRCEGILHYAVDHTPALFHISATEAISDVVAGYLDQLVTGVWGPCLKTATVIEEGEIRDARIARFQRR